MKPSFALDFRDGVIALHHRTARGWQQVGSAPLDAPDLTEALNYLRSTALGLSPRGVSTKLVIPNEQVLYTQVYAPGPDAAKRRRQIKAGIEGLTPYPLDDLVFDWWGNGPEVQVAVVARETLAEAEAFAAEHRFNPLSFVAVPDDGAFQGEPFFGPSALSATLLTQGEKVERDQEPVAVVGREFSRSDRGDPAPAEPAAVAPAAAKSQTAENQTDVPVADFAVREDPVAPPEPVTRADPAPEPEPEPAPEPAPPAEKVEKLPEAPVTPAAALDPDPLPDFRAAVPPPPGAKAFDPKTIAVDLVEEAPMAVDVSDDRPDEVTPAPPPPVARPQVLPRQDEDVPASPAAEVIAAFASRRAATDATGVTGSAPAAAAPTGSPTPKPTVISDIGKAPSLGSAPAQRPSVPRPSMARPPAAAPVMARGTLPFPAKTGPVVKPAGLAKPALKPTGPQVTAPGIAGARRERNVVPLPQPAAATDEDAAAKPPIVRPPSRTQTGLDGRPLPSSRKPRYLGLILTAILVVALVLVALWSSFFLTADDETPDTTSPAAANATLTPDVAMTTGVIPGIDTGSAPTTDDATFSADAQLGDLPAPDEAALTEGQDPSASDLAATAQAAAEQAAADQAAAIQAAAEQAAALQAIAEQAAADQAAADLAAAEQAAADKLAADQAAEQAAAAQAAAEQAAADKAAADKLAADQAAAEQAAADKLAADQAAADKAAADQAAAELAAEAARPEPAPTTALATDPAAATTPGADGQDEIFLAAADTPPATSDPVTLTQPVASGDPAPGLAPPPPPFGTVYQFDADGRIKPMPDGILTPDGVLLVAGHPKLVPPARPALAAAAAPVEPLPGVTTALPSATATLPAADAAAPDTGSAATVAAEPIFSDPALAGKKPKARPATLATSTDTVKQGDTLAPAQDSRFADRRPQPRPPALTVTPAVQPAVQTVAAETALTTDAALAAEALQPVSANRLTLTVSPNPPARPDGLNRAVEAAVAAAMRVPEPQTQVAAAAAADPEAQPEPEAEAPAPRLPTSASVAKQATDKNAINTGKIALIGVVSAGSSRVALIRQPGGNVKRLKVGDSLDGGRIAAISTSSLQYQKGNRMVTLSMPTS